MSVFSKNTYEKSEYHKSPLCKVACGGEGGAFLARLGVFAFFCKYRDKKCTPGAIHHWLCGM